MVSLIPKVIQLEASTRDEAFKVEELLEAILDTLHWLLVSKVRSRIQRPARSVLRWILFALYWPRTLFGGAYGVSLGSDAVRSQ